MHVLIVEPDAQSLCALKNALTKLFDVSTAKTPLEAVVKLDEKPIDAIVTNYEIGKASGLSALDQVRAQYPGIRRVLTTGRSTDDHEAARVARVLTR
jgi:DNA-binding NtrC family response regulator